MSPADSPTPASPAVSPKTLVARLDNAITRISGDVAANGERPYLTIARTDIDALLALLADLRRVVRRG